MNDNTERGRHRARQHRPLHRDPCQHVADNEHGKPQHGPDQEVRRRHEAVAAPRRASPQWLTQRGSATASVSVTGSIIAAIITTHMARNDAAAPGHVWPGIRIHVIDIVQPPGIGMPPIADMVAHHAYVTAALATKSTAQTPVNRLAPRRPRHDASRACRIRHGAATRRRSRCARAARGRATGTCPRCHRARARTSSRCDRRRRLRARRRSCRAARACRSPRRCRHGRQLDRRALSGLVRPAPASTPARAGSCSRCAVALLLLGEPRR